MVASCFLLCMIPALCGTKKMTRFCCFPIYPPICLRSLLNADTGFLDAPAVGVAQGDFEGEFFRGLLRRTQGRRSLTYLSRIALRSLIGGWICDAFGLFKPGMWTRSHERVALFPIGSMALSAVLPLDTFPRMVHRVLIPSRFDRARFLAYFASTALQGNHLGMIDLAAFMGLSCSEDQALEVWRSHQSASPHGDYTTYGLRKETLNLMNATMARLLPPEVSLHYGVAPTDL